jgi:hypothetical protein
VKRKLAKLDMRIQIGGAVLGVLLLALVGNMFLVSPKKAEATKLQGQIDSTQSNIYHRRAELKAAGHPPAIAVADLFKLTRAMPDRADMPGIMLTLSQVARSAGISFDLIEPVVGTTPSTLAGSQSQRMHLLFNGDFYGLSDFLYRLRNLVVVRDGALDASGRLFNTDTVTFNVAQDKFPQISAELYVNAYVYQAAPAAPATPVAPPTTEDAATADAGATAVGATP